MNDRFSRPALPSRISALSVGKAYGMVPVLQPVSFELEGGEALAIFGANGSGKTTLLRLLAQVERPSTGRIHIEGQGTVGLVGHDSYLYEDMSAFENLKFFSTISASRASAGEMGAVLDAVGLRGAMGDRVRGYSAGMKRRVGLARLLISQPDILLLDEPHASLDQDGQDLIDSLIGAARNAGHIVVVASHERERTAALCSHVLALVAGRTSFYGTVSEWQQEQRPRLVPDGRASGVKA